MDYFIFQSLNVGMRGWLMIPIRDAIEHYIYTRQKRTQTVELCDPQSQVISLKFMKSSCILR